MVIYDPCSHRAQPMRTGILKREAIAAPKLRSIAGGYDDRQVAGGTRPLLLRFCCAASFSMSRRASVVSEVSDCAFGATSVCGSGGLSSPASVFNAEVSEIAGSSPSSYEASRATSAALIAPKPAMAVESLKSQPFSTGPTKSQIAGSELQARRSAARVNSGGTSGRRKAVTSVFAPIDSSGGRLARSKDSFLLVAASLLAAASPASVGTLAGTPSSAAGCSLALRSGADCSRCASLRFDHRLRKLAGLGHCLRLPATGRSPGCGNPRTS